MASVKAYQSPLPLFPGWLEAIEGRAKMHGFVINTRYAEAFYIVKEIVK